VKKKFLKYAKESFDGILKTFVTIDDNGFVNLNKTVHGVGLGGNPYRDGSFEYYTSVPIRSNDLRALGPFILSALELEKTKVLKPFVEKSLVGKNKVVGLDYFFNHELKKDSDGKEYQYHYTWEDKENSGFYELGNVIENLGATHCAIKESPTLDNLKNVSIYVIVDPDTPKETEKPNYMETNAISEIVNWIKQGGVLVLMGNDKGNCEFEHINKLAEKFGFQFNEVSFNRVEGKNFDMGKFDVFPKHPIFEGLKKIYLKEISTFTLTPPAKPILTDSNNVVMAYSTLGKGFVFAVGDPWLYNEYIDCRKLPSDFENYKAGINLFKWLLSKSQEVKKNK
jgi:unsaturated rhamnogalacturonyl hydrolase